MTTVMLVDDHQLVRAGLAALIDAADDLDVVAQAADGREAVHLAELHRPDVILMDLSMPIMDGVQATRRLMAELPATRVVVLTSFADRDRVAEALASGAIGYLLKDCDPHELLSAVRAAAKGQTPLDPRVAGALLPHPAAESSGRANQPSPEIPALSAREREVLALVSNGLANKQIGRALGISERTVKVHLGNIFRRIGVGDRTSAALWAREHLVEPTRID
ncbi:MAG TPA: response regulator transcription factor [Propionibacteriaceae bacterium]|nr:response regulator transcription factor [Propionibacteriaceae bacterium]